MMTKLKQFCAVLTAILAVTAVVSAENPKIATVDMQKLFKEYYRTTAAQDQFNVRYASIQRKINELAETINQRDNALTTLQLEIENSELDDGQKSKKEETYKIIAQERKMLIAELQRFEEEEKRKVANLKKTSMQGIMREVRQKVMNVSDEQGYDFVFDKSGKNTNQVSFFLYLKDAKDITALMLKELNKLAPGAAGE